MRSWDMLCKRHNREAQTYAGPVAYLAFIDAVFALTPGDSHLEASKWFESFRTV